MDDKFCKFCGGKIPYDAIVCTLCGRQVEELSNSKFNINNVNNATISNRDSNIKNKWISLLLCVFLGYLGAHKFYEGKILFGLIYLFTFGIFGIGVIIDSILILLKPNPYLV